MSSKHHGCICHTVQVELCECAFALGDLEENGNAKVFSETYPSFVHWP